MAGAGEKGGKGPSSGAGKKKARKKASAAKKTKKTVRKKTARKAAGKPDPEAASPEVAASADTPRGASVASAKTGKDPATEDSLERFFFRPPRPGLEPALAALSSAPEAGWKETADGDGVEAYLTFRMTDEWYAVRISALQEIVKPLALTPVPRTPRHVEGVVTLRGVVLPVLDLHLRLGLSRPPAARSTRLLVLDSVKGPAAFLVEEVAGVWRPGEPIREPPPTSLGARGDLIEVLLRAEDQVIPLLDLEVALAVELEERGGRREGKVG